MKPVLDSLFQHDKHLVIAAPLASVSDEAFQRILHECNAPLPSTEMIPTACIGRNPKVLKKVLRWATDLHPMNVQLYGNLPEFMKATTELLLPYNPDVIDINMGCPAKKICRNGAGVALMNDVPRAEAIIKAIRGVWNGPLSVKFRLGVDRDDFIAVEFAKMVENSGADFITVHGRYRTSYSVPAEWDKIALVKNAVHIPVIGNGDIFTPEDAVAMLNQTGCDGVMIGRALLGNPWLPRRIQDYLDTGALQPEPDLKERFNVFSRHLDYLIDRVGERLAGLVFRKHAAWYLKGFPHIAHFRRKLFTFSRPEQFYGAVKQLLESYGVYI